MKRIIAISLSAMLLGLTTSARASAQEGAVVADALVVRPVCVLATAAGSVVFVLSLPFSALSKSVKSTAHVLVARPARAAFSRPMGDFDSFASDSDWSGREEHPGKAAKP